MFNALFSPNVRLTIQIYKNWKNHLCIRDSKYNCFARFSPRCYQIGPVVSMKLESFHCFVYIVKCIAKKVTFMISPLRNITPLTLLGHNNRSGQDWTHFLLFEFLMKWMGLQPVGFLHFIRNRIRSLNSNMILANWIIIHIEDDPIQSVLMI